MLHDVVRHHRVVGGVGNISFGELNETLEGRNVDIRLSDQRMIASRALRIEPDTTWAIDLLSGQVRGAATTDIDFISRKRTGRGLGPGDEDLARVERAIHLTINGIAAGLRNTG